MAEGAVTMSALVMLLIGVFDLGSALNQQLAVTRIAYEGARYASSLAGLEPCSASCSTLPIHSAVQQRITNLLTQSGLLSPQVQMTTQFVGPSREIIVRVEVPFRSVFPNPFVQQTTAQVFGTHLFPAAGA